MSRSPNSHRKGFGFGSVFQHLSKLGRAVPTEKPSRMKRRLLLSSFLLILFFPVYSFGATITSNATGNWSAGGTRLGGVVPASADDVVIANGHTVTLTAGVTTTGGLTVSGTLQLAGFSMTSG